MTDMMWIIDFAHALQLCHIDLIRKIPIEKGIIYIKLANAQLTAECNAKNSTNELYTWLLVKGIITGLKVS